MLNTARKLYEENKNEEALVLYNEFLVKNPNHAEALFFRALIYRKQNEHEKSLTDLSLVVNRLPEQAAVWFERGITYAYLDKQKEALLDMDKAVELEPENAFRYAGRAYIKAMFKMYDEAIADYEKALTLDPDDEIALNNLGLLQEQKGYWEKARQSFEKSNEIYNRKNPDNQLPNYQNTHKTEKNEHLQPAVEPSVKDYFSVIKNVFRHKSYFTDYLRFVKSLLSIRRR